MWPCWMYNDDEASNIVTVLYDARSNHIHYTQLIDLCRRVADQYRSGITYGGIRLALKLMNEHEGQVTAVKHAFYKWSDDTRLKMLYQVHPPW